MNFLPSNSAAILNELLSQPDPPLEEVLDCDSVVIEARHPNPKLITYLCKPKNFNAMISYVTKIPSDLTYNATEPHKDAKVNKFPFVASDILAIDNDAICNYFLGLLDTVSEQDVQPEKNASDREGQNDKSPTGQSSIKTDLEESCKNGDGMCNESPPISEFLKFLGSPVPINFTQAGYFAKILKNLFFYRADVTGRFLFRTHFDLIERMTIHAYSDSIQEILTIILKLEPSYFKGSPADKFYTERMILINRLIGNIFSKPDKDLDDSLYMNLQWNSSVIISTIISQNTITVSGKQIIQDILTPENLHKYISGLFNTSLITPLTNVVIHLCDFYTQANAPKKGLPRLDLINFTNTTPAPEFDENDPFLLEVLDSIEGIKSCLDTENKKLNPTGIPSQFGTSSFAFGIPRLKLLDVLFAFIKLQNQRIDLKIFSCKLINILLDLIIKNPWNDVLNFSIKKIINYIISFGSDTLKSALLSDTEADLLSFIIKHTQDTEVQIKSKTGGRVQKSNSAHLIALANSVEASDNDLVQYYSRKHSSWQEFVSGYLATINEKYNTVVGGDAIIDHNFKNRKVVLGAEKELEDIIEDRIPNIEGNEEGKSNSKFEEIKNENPIKTTTLNLGGGLIMNDIDESDQQVSLPKPSSAKLGFSLVNDIEEEEESEPKTPVSNKANKFTPASFEEAFQ